MLVRDNYKIEKAINDSSLSEAIIFCILTNLGVEQRILDNAATMTYVSVDERKIIDCSCPDELTWLVERFVNEHAKFVNYNNPSSLVHVYTYALVKSNDTNDGWYDLSYVQLQIETEYPIQTSKCTPVPCDIEPFMPYERIDMHSYLYDNIFTISDDVTFHAEEDRLLIISPPEIKVEYLKNPQHIMAEILAKRLMTLGWLPKDHEHAGDFLHMVKDDDHLLISCTSKNAALINKDGSFPDRSITEYIAKSGYVFDTDRMFSMTKRLLMNLEEMQNLYNGEYITWLYNKHSEDIKAIDEYRTTGDIKGVIKESTYCYRLWNGRGPTQLIQNPVSLNIIFMRELIADGYIIDSIEYDYINLRNKDNDVTVIINTTTNEPIAITSPQIPLSYEHQVAANLGIKINYIVMSKNETVAVQEPEFSKDVETARMNLLKFLSSYYKIYTTEESTAETFLELKKLLNDLYVAYTGIKYIDSQHKNPSRFFSAVKVEKLLKDCKIPFTIKSTASNGSRTTIITPIDVDGNPVIKAHPVEIAENKQHESDPTPTEDESTHDTSEYNSIL